MLDLVKKLKERGGEIKFGKFQCPIGNVEAEIFPMPSFKRESDFSRWASDPNRAHYPCYHDLSEKEITAVSVLHNFPGKHSVSCSKMNLEKKDNGDMYCTVTDAPGTCLAMPRERGTGKYSHETCPYLSK